MHKLYFKRKKICIIILHSFYFVSGKSETTLNTRLNIILLYQIFFFDTYYFKIFLYFPRIPKRQKCYFNFNYYSFFELLYICIILILEQRLTWLTDLSIYSMFGASHKILKLFVVILPDSITIIINGSYVLLENCLEHDNVQLPWWHHIYALD